MNTHKTNGYLTSDLTFINAVGRMTLNDFREPPFQWGKPMGSIKTTYDLSRDLTLVRAKGGISIDDFIFWGATNTSKRATALSLWDLSEADICQLSSDEIRMIATCTKGISFVCQGGKIAFVLAKPCDFGVGRMLEAYNEAAEMISQIRAFHTIRDAKQWLGL